MRYRLPEGCVGVAGAGIARDGRADAEAGTIDADPEAAAHLAPHGIVPVDDAAAVDPKRVPQPKRSTRK